MDDVKPFAEKEKELEILTPADRIFSKDTGIEIFVMLIMRSRDDK